MPEPLRYRFRVGCPAERAFELWTASAGVWWPMATHSVSGRRDSVLGIQLLARARRIRGQVEAIERALE